MGIYIHIPFCASKCRYCDFFSRVVNNEQDKDAYVDALCQEIKLQKNYLDTLKIDTLYFGGGTPSVLSIKQLERLFAAIFQVFELEKNNEITLEANPEDLNIFYLKNLKKYTPINRLSVGLQSFSDAELDFMNRKHSVETSILAIKNAQKTGFENITGDLIFGLPNQTLEQWNNNLKQFFELNIPHLSAYSLTIEEGTVFGLWKKNNKIKEVDEELSLKMYETLILEAEKKGYQHYEISNFAKDGFIAKHNSSYWTGQKYIGVGASAHSFNQKSRQWNVANIKQYIASIKNGIIPAEIEILSEKDKFNEYILTGLRTYNGLCLSKLELEFEQFYKKIKQTLFNFVNSNFIDFKNNRFILSSKGKFLSDAIMSDLILL
ncbi:MAG: radical SAM family heme chaperone HemW [Bacteroidales bacterium]|nr:radical SAM family heme chaperone HemW [Bacteroidales bacterium]